MVNMAVNSTAALKYTELFASAELSEHTYKVNTNPLSWWEAQTHCISLGGNLATIRSNAENERVQAQSNSNVWIGLNDLESEGRWRWVGGEYPVFTKWDSGQPDNWHSGEDCAHMRSNGVWNDAPCRDKLASVCEFGAGVIRC